MDAERIEQACKAWVDGSWSHCGAKSHRAAVERELAAWRSELAILCRDQALKTGEAIGIYLVEADGVLERLRDCLWESWLHWEMTPRGAEGKGEPSPPRWLWHHRNLELIFRSGVQGTNYFQIDKDALAACADDYLSRAWLRHPRLDWVLVDAMMAQEIVSFGEQMKAQLWVNASLFDVKAADAYERSKGKFSELEAIRLRSKLKVGLLKVWWFTVVPVLAAILLASSGASGGVFTWFWWALGAYGLAYVVNLATLPILIGYRVWKLRGWPRNPRELVLKLHGSMTTAYGLLDARSISPTALKEALAETAKAGSVWPQPIRPLLERVIVLDGPVWNPVRTLARRDHWEVES